MSRAVNCTLLVLLVTLVGGHGPSDAKRVYRDAKQEKPWLGVGIQPGALGARIIEVIDGTPAALAGIRVNDEIVSVSGEVIKNDKELVARLAPLRVGDHVSLGVLRGRKRLTLRPQLSAMLDENELLHRRLVDKPAPNFDLPVVDGSDSGTLADLQGKVVVVEFWATWCGACKQTYETLSGLRAEHGGDLVVLGVTSESSVTVKRFLNNFKLGFTVLHDAGSTVRSLYQTNKMPTLVVIDRDGIVRHAGIGADLNLDHAVYAAERALRRRRF